jgi:hypothetical protein
MAVILPSVPTVRPINPYLHPVKPRTNASHHGTIPYTTNCTVVNNAPYSAIMGVQSQRRNGSIAKCMKRATKRKAKHRMAQHSIDGSVPFHPLSHCKICKVRAANKAARREKFREPKRSHHRLCPKNRKTRGMSEATVLGANEFMQNRKSNSTRTPIFPPSIAPPPPAYQFFERRPATAVALSTSTSDPAAKTSIARNTALTSGPSNLRLEVDSRIKIFHSESAFHWAKDKAFPPAVGLMADYICGLLEHRRPADTSEPLPTTILMEEAIHNYRQFFAPGKLDFTFPSAAAEAGAPSPYYHALQETTIMLVDWKLAFPNQSLRCYTCKNTLEHERTNFSKKRSLFPLWSHNGPTWCVVMNYKCSSCNICYAANDGRLLSMLNPAVAAAYPVMPTYAAGTFHLHRDFTDFLEPLMRTYGNGPLISSMVYRKMGIQYTRSAETYIARGSKANFISAAEYHGQIFPPTDKGIRDAYLHSEYSELKPYGHSNFERYEREMQSVEISKDEMCAFDWTFAVVGNYANLPGAKCCFTMNKGSTGEMADVKIVASTSVSQVSHAMIQRKMRAKDAFDPGVVYHDTCPHLQTFLKGIFGQSLEAKLGLFHLLHRIVETLDPRSELYWQCLVALKNCIYSYYDGDEAKLITALKNGTFSRDGQKWTDQEIRDLRHSKIWNPKCGSYLRKLILQGSTIAHRLQLWIQRWLSAIDFAGRPVFTQNTEKIALEQLKKVEHVADSSFMEHYEEIPPGPRSTHGLSKWRSNRPESQLEGDHLDLAHYANGGMRKELADALTLGGVCEGNVKKRWRYASNKKKQAGLVDTPTASFANIPVYFDHSYLHHLNGLAASGGLDPIFDDVRVPPSSNNGDVYLSKYFDPQQIRNQTTKQDLKTKMCLCTPCRAFQPQLLVASNNQAQRPAINNQAQRPPPPRRSPQVLPPLRRVPQILPPPSYRQHQPPAPAVAQMPPPPPHRQHQPSIPPPPYQQYHQYPRTDCCQIYCSYLAKKQDGQTVMGKPPHDKNCPVRQGIYFGFGLANQNI